MILHVPVPYKALVVPPRKRDWVAVDLCEPVALELREATGEEAPVVLWWPDDRHPGLQVAVRCHEGALYRPYQWSHHSAPKGGGCAHPDGTAARRVNPDVDGDALEDPYDWKDLPPLGAEAFAERLVAGTAMPGKAPSEKAPSAIRTLSDVPARRVESNGYEGAVSTWREHMAGLLSVDGIMYARAPAPVYVVTVERWGVPELRAGWDDAHGHRPDRAYPPTDRDAAEARLRATMRVDGPEHRMPPPVRLLRADLLPRFDHAEHVLAPAVALILDAMEARGQGSRYEPPKALAYGRELAMAYAGLRDAARTGAGPGEVHHHLGAFAEACYPHGTLSDLREVAVNLLDRAVPAVSAEEADMADAAFFAGMGSLP